MVNNWSIDAYGRDSPGTPSRCGYRSGSCKCTSFNRHNWACLVKVRMQKARLGICKYGEQAKSPYESMTLIRKIKKGFWQLLSIIKNRNFSLQFFFTLIRTKILSLQYPQGLLWKILFYIAFLLLEPLRNSGQIVNTQATTCMSAYVLRGRDSVACVWVSRPVGL